jgi:kynurenine formamidase
MGEYVQKDQAWLMSNNDAHIGFISEVMIGCMHTGCHMDSLAHITVGKDNHWYNGFNAAEHLGDWGPLKADISTTPPVGTRGVMIDVAGYKGMKMLPKAYCITANDLRGALAKQKTTLKPGDTVLVRTGQLSAWPNPKAMGDAAGAGMGLEAVKWLAEKNKTILMGVDTAAFECDSPDPTNPHPVHQYMLIENGIHIMEFPYLEDLAKDKVYEFMFCVSPLKNKGCTGSMIRPIAVN